MRLFITAMFKNTLGLRIIILLSFTSVVEPECICLPAKLYFHLSQFQSFQSYFFFALLAFCRLIRHNWSKRNTCWWKKNNNLLYLINNKTCIMTNRTPFPVFSWLDSDFFLHSVNLIIVILTIMRVLYRSFYYGLICIVVCVMVSLEL